MSDLQFALPIVLTFAVLAASNLDIMLRAGCVAMMLGSSLPVLAVVGRPGLTICTAAGVSFMIVGVLRSFGKIR